MLDHPLSFIIYQLFFNSKENTFSLYLCMYLVCIKNSLSYSFFLKLISFCKIK